MNEPFNLPVSYKGEEQEFKARFERWGYTHRFIVLIGEETVIFEPDDAGDYRALGHSVIGVSLLQAIAEKLRSLTAV